MTLSETRTRVRRDLKDEVPSTQVSITIDDCDAIWTAVSPNSVTLDTSNKQQGTASVRANVNESHATGLVCYRNITALDLTGYDWVRFWVRCLSDLDAGDLQLKLDDSQGCGSPVKSLDIPALVSGVWHEHQVLLGDTSGLSAIASVGLSVAVDKGAISVWLDNIRALKDSHKWEDDELDRHIAHALRELSHYIPYEATADIATTGGSREISIASLSDRIRVLAVEYPIGKQPPRYRRFSLWQDTITLLGDAVPDGSDCRVYYGKLHTIDVDGSTVPVPLEDLVSLGTQGYALQAYASYAVERGQADYHYGQGVALEESRKLLGDFRAQLKRLGRQGRVRASSLYVPATEPAGESGVVGW
jgi:hypothetical protein